MFALICIRSTIRVDQQGTRVGELAAEMRGRHRMNRNAVNGFPEVLRANRGAFGTFYVDYAVAAIALEALVPRDGWVTGVQGADALMFHVESAVANEVLKDAAANYLDTCTLISGTRLVVCTRAPVPPGKFGALRVAVVSRQEQFPSP